MARNPILLAMLLVAPVAGIRPRSNASRTSSRLPGMSLATLPMHMYRQDCWQRHPVAFMAAKRAGVETHSAGKAARKAALPGAGLGEIVPFETVLKDGYYPVDCLADYMFTHGDKFGDTADEYELASVSNVSIVHYSAVVPREDQEKMSHAVCFAFCRTVPEMLFFGIRNGYDCYCAPYYKPMADDSSMCDQPCEGELTQICGGKSKSSIFQMHMCNNLMEELSATGEKFDEIMADMETMQGDLTSLSEEMQAGADKLQAIYGQAGDPAASDLMQTAKVFAGDLEKGATEVGSMVEVMTETKDGLAAIEGGDPADFAWANEAEGFKSKMEHFTVIGEEKVEEMDALKEKANTTKVYAGAGKEYFNAMYFVDKEFETVPSTCSGTPVGSPMLGSVDACASACDAEVHSCVGFSFFSFLEESDRGICVMLSKFKTMTYYTGCEKGAAFLQKKLADTATNSTQCMAKFSKFEGTTLKPNPSGKCEQCFREATDAGRCFGF